MSMVRRVHSYLAIIAAALAALVISGCIVGAATTVRPVTPLARIRLAWQAGPFLPGGTLRISGENFSPGGRVELTVANCGTSPYRLYPVTSTSFRTCAPGTLCTWRSGGQFEVSVPCSCGGYATVVAVDEATGTQDSENLAIACY